jgi:hypothetical protein
MRRLKALFIAIVAFVIAPLAALTIYANSGPQSGNVVDEAQRVQRDAASFPAADEDYFRGMDAGAALTAEEIKGRNTWMVWTGGNDRFWDELIRISFGNFDLLKILSSYPGLRYSRDNRFEYFGLINEPCFEKATGPNPARFGLWLDSRGSTCDPDPFENEQKYPGVAIGARSEPACGLVLRLCRPASLDCDCSRTPISTRPLRRHGIQFAFTATRATTIPRTLCGPIGLE